MWPACNSSSGAVTLPLEEGGKAKHRVLFSPPSQPPSGSSGEGKLAVEAPVPNTILPQSSALWLGSGSESFMAVRNERRKAIE